MMLADGQESDVLEREALERSIPIVEGLILATSRDVGCGDQDDGQAESRWWC